jgi:hypothetical protein
LYNCLHMVCMHYETKKRVLFKNQSFHRAWNCSHVLTVIKLENTNLILILQNQNMVFIRYDILIGCFSSMSTKFVLESFTTARAAHQFPSICSTGKIVIIEVFLNIFLEKNNTWIQILFSYVFHIKKYKIDEKLL